MRRTGQAEFRARTHARDRGVCRSCGLDTGLLERTLFHLIRYHSEPPHAGQDARAALVALGWSRAQAMATVLPFAHSGRLDAPLWEADHVVPVCEGGNDDVGNARTLCVPCHSGETSALLTRRARQRSGSIQNALWGTDA